MINRGEILRCNLCQKVLAVNEETGPMVQGRIQEDQLKKVWMPSVGVHICKACKTKFKRGGGIPKDIREEEEK